MSEYKQSSDPPSQALIFRCPKELEGLIPAPVPAGQGLPPWFKAMPQQAFSAIAAGDDDTVKKCPAFIDAMTCGFLIPLMCDVTVKDGEFTWENELPAGGSVAYARSPIGFHDAGQVTGTPLHDPDRFLIKFHNLWTIEAPPGYSLLITHPANRFDLPFTTITGWVDGDRYHDAWIHFPAVWRDEGFSGVLPKGTPIAQCIPVKREPWAMRTEAFSDQDAQATHDVMHAIGRESGVYRRRYRA